MTGSPGAALILGASSDIGVALAREYAKAAYSLILAARQVQRLEAEANNLKHRYGASVKLMEFDVLDVANHRRFVEEVGGIPEVAICVVGLMGNQSIAESDYAAADLIMRTNYNGPAIVFDELAAQMERRGSGWLIGISSVAGDRGRAVNYLYGSAKAGFTAYLSGLRNRLAKKGVRVMTVKPGFVRTRMTADMSLPGPLTAEAAEVARAVMRAQRARRDIVYVRPAWRFIMLMIRLIPERFFKQIGF